MPITVNTNIASINAQRSLNKSSNAMTKAMERLSSGLRINRAGDDAAGLAIADGLQSQVRGLTQASRNANDGLSLVGMAEGALTTQVAILQRIRELSVQAANDINSADNRTAIQQEINNQVDELTRIATTTEFNGQNLMNGTFTNKEIHVGAYAQQSISVSLGDFRAAQMGQIAQITTYATGTSGSVSTIDLEAGPIDGSSNTTTGDGVTITANSKTTTVGVSQSDGISSYYAANSAIAKANAINQVSSDTGVTASVGEAKYIGTTVVTGTVGATASVEINGVTVIDGSVDNFATVLNDGNGAIRNAINAKSNETGVVASLDSANKLVLTAADGRNIVLKVANGGTNVGLTTGDGTAAGVSTHTASGLLTLTSRSQFTVNSDGGAGNTMLGINSGTNDSVSVAVDPNKAVNQISVTSRTGANTAIEIVDSALAKIAEEQSKLGALTNRLENTISNLQVSIENLSASESRIRDADFAVETANLTRAQILQQSGVAVLTQANVMPQTALSLIGG